MNSDIDFEHWDEAVVKSVKTRFETSTKGSHMLFCPMCTAHIDKREIRERDGECPGCTAMSEAEDGRRGAL